jgi:uncharacterized membrane protein (UPF0136 family)
MLRTLAKSVLIGAAQRRAGVMPAGSVSAALLTTGASLMLTRGRRPIGLALVAAGGMLLWRETEQRRATAVPAKADGEAEAAG